MTLSFFRQPRRLDANRYATKKTIAQGMLDVALLTANASQLKYVLTKGNDEDGGHPFYTLMLTLIVISIVLQVKFFLSMSLSRYSRTPAPVEQLRKKRVLINACSCTWESQMSWKLLPVLPTLPT